MRARRVDSNLQAIVQAARQCGFKVYVRNDDLADADVQNEQGKHELWEIKERNGRYTELQKLRRQQGWKIRLVRTVEDVLQARREMMVAHD